jgi:hypothetical protein
MSQSPTDGAGGPHPTNDRLDALESENHTLRERLRWAELLLEIQAKTRQFLGHGGPKRAEESPGS